MEWIIQNKEWLFSGIGVLVISTILGTIIRIKSGEKTHQNIQSGNNSNNVQAGKNVNVSIGGEKNEK